MERTSWGRRASRLACAGLAVMMLLGASPSPAYAGWFDRVRDIFEMPEQVDELKAQYQEVKEGYDSTLQQLEETRLQAEEARLRAEEYRQQQEKLQADNEGLIEENRKLAETILELQHSEEARARQAQRIKNLVWTAVLLTAGFFGISRVARYVLRVRARG